MPLPYETEIVVESAVPKDGPNAAARALVEKKLKLARTQFKTASEAESHYRKQAVLDSKFRAGTWGDTTFQWPDGVAEARRDTGRPCLTINRMPAFIRQVTNQARTAHLSIQVNPVDDQGDPEVAEVLQGIIHNIEVQSFADRAYAMGSEKQAEQGRGFFRLLTEWVDEYGIGPETDLFRQRIRIERELNPLAIYVDPNRQRADYSDATYAFKVVDVDKDEYEALTNQTDVPTPASAESFGSEGDETGDWFPNGKIRIAEWFNLETRGEKRRFALMDDGAVIPYPSDEQLVQLTAAGAKILRDRWVTPKVMVWRKIDACHILEETEWVVPQIPWIPVIGDELLIEGEIDYRGVVRDSKGSAQAYNVEVSALVESVGLGSKAPLIGYRGQFGEAGSPTRKAWETAHLTPHPFLEVEPMDIDGKPVPLPQRNTFEPPLQGVVIAIKQTDNDLKSTAGFNDVSLGERGPQESGKAILARQRQDELGSSHYLDNLRFALCSAGKQLIRGIRKVYDTPQIVRITGKDERQKRVMVFAGAANDPRTDPAFQFPPGVSKVYDLGVGEYDVEVSAGPSSGTRRQEAVEAMTALFQHLPPAFAVKFLDLYFLMMDFPKAHQMAERAKMLLPPELQDESAMENVPPEIVAKIAAMKQQLAQAMQRLQQAETIIKTDQVKAQARLQEKIIDTQSKERIAGGQQQTELVTTEATLNAKAALQDIRNQIESIQQMLGFVHEQRMEDTKRKHDAAHDVGLRLLEHAIGTAAAGSDTAPDGTMPAPDGSMGMAPAAPAAPDAPPDGAMV